MFYNYILLTFRGLRKNVLHSFINVIGLSVGIVAVIMIFSYVRFELSYDKHFPDHDRICRISLAFPEGALEREIATNYPVVHRTFPSEFPEIEVSTRLQNAQFSGNRNYIRIEEDIFPDQRIYYGDSTFFEMFQVPLLAGDPGKALTGIDRAVITREAAMRYFGTINCLGRWIKLNDQRDFLVSGIMSSIPANTHFHFDVLVAMGSHPWEKQSEWNGLTFSTYFKLREGVKVHDFERKIQNYLIGLSAAKNPEGSGEAEFSMPLMPISHIHLKSHKEMELEANSDSKYVFLFSSIALFILLIACVNYINLATSRSLERAKEVGLRKIFGAYRRHLIFQFLGESIIICVIAFLLSLGMIELCRPYFMRLVDMQMSYSFFFNGLAWMYYVLFIIMLSLLAGLYPSLYLSRFMPDQVLKGKFSRSRSAVRFRKSLVVFQFFISIFLIVGSLVIYRQLDYMLSKDLGIDKDHIVAIPFYNNEMSRQSETIKARMKAHHSIINGCAVSQLPINIDFSEGISNTMSWSTDDPEMFFLHADRDFFQTMGVELVEGKMFTGDYSEHYSEYIVNRAGMQILSENPETLFARNIRIKHDGITLGPVIGIVEDFNFASLHDDIGPLVISQNPIWYSYLLFKMQAGNPAETLTYMKETLQEIVPEAPFEYQFLDQEFDNLYKTEHKINNVVSIFTILAIFIACIGLFGVSAYETIQRTKEVGIRKVLGSSALQVVRLFIIENIRLVVISILIAIPTSYYLMNNWLRDFAYRIQIRIELILPAILFVLAITIITVTYHAIKAALINPSETLRNE